MGTDFDFDIEIRYGAGAFVCGEETALIHSMEGKRGEPTLKPPFPAEAGYNMKPTNVNNVETLANVPIILTKGADWFASIGTEKSKGTKVFALAGKINNVGLIEVPMGTTPDMTWDCTKVKFDMDFTTPRDVVIVCGPDQQVMLFYNLLKGIVEPMTKELFKNLDKASKEEGEFFTIFCAELVMDLEYSTRFTAIWQGEGSLKEKAKAIAELTWPKLQESAKKYVQERIDLWTKDRCIEVFGFVDVAKLETGIENITKNMNKYLKVVEKVGDGLLSTLGVLEGLNDVYGSGYYELDLDFNSICSRHKLK